MAATMAALAGSVSLQFALHMQEGEFKLLEVSEAVLKEIMASEFDADKGIGKGLVEFRGAAGDGAALCTASKTYSVRLVESSNTQLLVRATPANVFLPLEAERIYDPVAVAAVKEDAANNPAAKRQKRDSGEAGSSNNGNGDANGGDSVFVPSRYIAGMVAHHYEVTEILPRLHVLRELLNKSVYEEDEEEHEAEEAAEAEAAIAAAAAAAAAADAEDDEEEKAGAAMSPKRKRNSTTAAAAATPAARPRYTTAHLRQLVQASDAELFAGLDALDAFEDSRGHWRILSPSLSASLLDSILLLTEEKRWAPRVSDLPADEVAEGLKELYPQLVTKQALKAFSKKQTEGSDKNLFTLDAEKVARLRALQLFAMREPYPHVDFLRDWSAAMPAGLAAEPVRTEWLRGHALCESSAALEALARSASGALQVRTASSVGGAGAGAAAAAAAAVSAEDATKVWRYWPLTALSPLIKTRFTQLFDMRPRWSLADIAAYTEDLCAPGQTLEQLLLKNARPVSTEVNGVRQIVYTKR